MVAAGEVAQGGDQPRTDAVDLEVLRDGGVVESAAAGAGPIVPLVFGDLRRQPGQLRDLMPGRLGVVRRGARRQRLPAAVAVAGNERDDQVETLRRQASLQAQGVSGLSARLFAGALSW